MIQYPWLQTTYNKILKSYRLNRGHHAIILYSQQNYGEDILIDNLSKWLMCLHPCQNYYCSDCKNCFLMQKKCHPDYYQLQINQNDVQKTIGVDIIRNCINSLYKSAQFGKIKIVFIKKIEHLTVQAINVLLKTIEEPPKNTYFFLSTRNNINIPITLLSRCTKWVISSPIEEQGLIWLMKKQKKIDTVSAKTALRLSNGSPIEANSMFETDFWDHRIKLCNFIEKIIINKNFLELLPIFLNTKKYNNQPIFWLITLLIDVLKCQHKINKKFFVNLDRSDLIFNIATQWNIQSVNNQAKQWIKLFSIFQKIKKINYELILTFRLLNWKLDVIETFL